MTRMKKNCFIIDVKDLFVEDNGIINTYRMSDSILESNSDDFLGAIVNGKLEVFKISSYDILVEFDLYAKIYINCVRCLKKFLLPMRIKFNQTYFLNPPKGENEYVIINYKVDVSKVIVEELISQLPIKPLCKQDCFGIKGYSNYRKE